jgi:uncharacterized protein (DUF1501 family)
MKATRRQFLASTLASSALVSLGGSVPLVLRRAAAAEGGQADHVLVVVQLSGGNDGLNTIVPYRNEEYRKRRPTLAIAESGVLKINDDLGFHPSLRGAAALLEQGWLSILQGVGYSNPNRSHFESMDIWHTGQRKLDRRREGWLGRLLEASPSSAGRDVPAIHLGQEQQPLALSARNIRVPSVASLDRFRLQDISDAQVRERIRLLTSAERDDTVGDLLGFVQSSAVAALDASARLEQATRHATSSVTYPNHPLSEKLRTVAQLISAGMKTRIYYVALDGFDTHAQQAAAHRALLGHWGDAMQSFYKDLQERGHAERVLMLSFSEFGRRVAENASEGTDHGAAAPVFLSGPAVKAGLIGEHPSVTDLDDGDLKHHTDFRQVYATVLEQWMQTPSQPILGDKYTPVPAIAAAVSG